MFNYDATICVFFIYLSLVLLILEISKTNVNNCVTKLTRRLLIFKKGKTLDLLRYDLRFDIHLYMIHSQR